MTPNLKDAKNLLKLKLCKLELINFKKKLVEDWEVVSHFKNFNNF